MQIVQQIRLGGVLVAPIERGNREVLVRCTRTAEGVFTEDVYDVRFVPMTGAIRTQ